MSPLIPATLARISMLEQPLQAQGQPGWIWLQPVVCGTATDPPSRSGKGRGKGKDKDRDASPSFGGTLDPWSNDDGIMDRTKGPAERAAGSQLSTP